MRMGMGMRNAHGNEEEEEEDDEDEAEERRYSSTYTEGDTKYGLLSVWHRNEAKLIRQKKRENTPFGERTTVVIGAV